MSNFRKARVSLRTKLMVLFLTLVIWSNLILGVLAIIRSNKAVAKEVDGHLAAVSADVANQVSDIIHNEFAALMVLADTEFYRNEAIPLKDKAKELTAIAKRLGGHYENIGFYDRNGNSYAADGTLANFAEEDYFTEAIKGNNFVSEPMHDTEFSGLDLMFFSVPVRNNKNEIIGAIVTVRSGNPLLDLVKNIDLGGGMHPAVVSRKSGQTLANANPKTDDEGSNISELDTSKGLGLALAHLMEGKTGQEDFIDPFNHSHVITAYKPIPDTDWSIFGAASYDFYFAEVRHMNRTIWIIIAVTIVIATLSGEILINVLIKPLRSVKTSVTEIASGNADLTKRLPDATNDEIGDVVTGFNSFVAKLQDIVKNISGSKSDLSIAESDLSASIEDTSSSIKKITENIDSVNNQIMEQSASVTETSSAVTEISSNIESLERMIDNQSAGVTNASSAVEQMIGNINSVNSAVEKMVSSFTLLEQNANNGIRTQSEANERIKQIEEQSKMLKDANAAIANIAAQTNLLAMNAAIEAAHAGESGKGFSVVADEIRKLSETSTQQSKTIGEELKKIEDTIVSVVAASQNTNTALSSVSSSISDTSQIISQIKGAMEEQQIGSKQIIESLQTMNNSTSEVKLASAEMTEGNKQILVEVEKLQSLTANIKNNMNEMQSSLTLVNESSKALNDVSSKVSTSVQQIGSQIDLFKI